MRWRLLIIVLLVAGVYCFLRWDDIVEPGYLHQFDVPKDKLFLFKDLEGPDERSEVPEPVVTSWRKYHVDDPSAFAIFLTDTASDWIGLVHGLKNIGVPVTVTNDLKEALSHKTIMVYPIISGAVLTGDDLRALAAVPRNGGNLIGVNIYGGGLNEVFGFDTLIAASNRSQLLMNPALSEFTTGFTHEREQNVRLTNPIDFPDELPTNGYTNARTPLIAYKEDNTAFLAYKDYGVGKAFAFGLDLGNYFMRYMNERGFNAYHTYANVYDPGMDVFLRILKNIYTRNADVVTIGTVPFNKSVSLLMTHDVDYTKSIVNAVEYARMEQELGVKATYFIQTKYVKDWNDDIFFKDATVKYLDIVKKFGMEIASHSISHSRVFAEFELGTGKEHYPRYKPFVQERTVTYNGSILGELRVSKFLLEKLVPDVQVISFRPGHLQHPFALPQALAATGYKYSSAVTANNVQTHLPYMQMYNREFKAEMDIVEIPITIEDELGAPMLQRLDSALMVADQLSKYGGVMNVLIHTDTLGGKFEFERRLILVLRDKAWVGSVRELGGWWHTRNQVLTRVVQKRDTYEVHVSNPGKETIQGFTLHVPATWVLAESNANYIAQPGAVVIKEMKEGIVLRFTRQIRS